MEKKPVLVVMAAGMGSRFGGLKQIAPVGRHGEAILDYSLYDAYEAGFRTAVIIIKEAIRKDFMDTVGKRLENCPMEIRYAYQELEMLPEGFSLPNGRTKPLGTSHAILCAAEAIGDAPFGVINSDDYYGKSAYRKLYDFLLHARDDEKHHYCMVGYELGKTVSDNGTVTRGICQISKDNTLASIREQGGIRKDGDRTCYLAIDGKTWKDISSDVLVSMNMWGFTGSFLAELKIRFPIFLRSAGRMNLLKAEFLLPTTVGDLLRDGKSVVHVLHSEDKWYGVTYAADRDFVVEALARETEQGKYPAEGLWTAKE